MAGSSAQEDLRHAIEHHCDARCLEVRWAAVHLAGLPASGGPGCLSCNGNGIRGAAVEAGDVDSASRCKPRRIPGADLLLARGVKAHEH